MTDKSMSSYKSHIMQYGTPISPEDFRDLRKYANSHNISLSQFRDYVGNIDTIKILIDDISTIALDFPKIVEGRYHLELKISYDLGTDFATTNNHIIRLNGVYFSNMKMLQDTYDDCEREGRFVKGTNWRSIIRHEVGHIVSNKYHLNPLQIAASITNSKNIAYLFDYIEKNLSKYAVEEADGSEIVAESFSGYYSNVNNSFADAFVTHCIKLAKGGEMYES